MKPKGKKGNSTKSTLFFSTGAENGSFETLRLEKLVKSALTTIKNVFDFWRETSVAVSFNGGKDCSVVLELMQMALQERFPPFKHARNHLAAPRGQKYNKTCDFKRAGVRALWWQTNDDFPELRQHCNSFLKMYGLRRKTLVYKQCSYRKGLENAVNKHGIKVVIMGQRRSDPGCAAMNEFQETTEPFVPCMRVNPILDWTTRDVWLFLRLRNVPTCALYAQGYESLGKASDTIKTISKKRKNGELMHAADVALDHTSTQQINDAGDRKGRTSSPK